MPCYRIDAVTVADGKAHQPNTKENIERRIAMLMKMNERRWLLEGESSTGDTTASISLGYLKITSQDSA